VPWRKHQSIADPGNKGVAARIALAVAAKEDAKSFDKANNRDGSSLMIHGDCSSSGCYAMTDEQMGEIYSLARDSLLGGRPSFQIQAYPFRLTPENLARHRTNPHLAFGKMLKIGNDHFEATHLEPKVDVCNRLYVFDAEPPPNSPDPLVFNPTGKCPAIVVNRKSRGRRWRNNAPTSSNTRNFLKTTCRPPPSTADWTAE
jgi:hypothetical protein